MELVVDANILFSALIAREGLTRELIVSTQLSLFTPEYVLEEFNNHVSELSTKTCLPRNDVVKILTELISHSNLKVIPLAELKKTRSEAQHISPDPDDVHYFALALKQKCGIWSNDKKLKTQDTVRVYSTKDLVKLSLKKK